MARLRSEGLEAVESPDHDLAVRLNGAYPLTPLESFREGLFQVQDESMQKVIDELDLEPNLKVLDVCSAPGTKATAMAERMLDQGMILALDRSFPRMSLLFDNMRRLGIHSIRPVIADARLVQSISRTLFDRILVDAPCSNTGVLSRRVEARWRYSLSDLKRLSNLQMEILEGALKVMKPGGLLVYSTCSIDPAENEELVQRVLKGKSDVELLAEQTFFPTEAQGGGYWAKIKRVKNEE
jgi:16S rRNA (cytosine967-C5)-methyltransferase